MLLNNNKSRENRAPRIRAILLLLLIFTSAITTLPILQSADAGAVTKYTDISSMTDQIKSLLYSNTIEDCMKNSSLNDSSGTGWTEISDTDAKSGQWFRAGNSLIKWGAQRLLQGNFDSSIGVYMKDTTGGAAGEDNDGLVECGNPSLILGALALWGLTGEELDVLCNSGFTRTNIANTQNVDQCVKGTGNLKRTDSNFNTSSADFTNYINAQVYDSAQQPELTPAQWYLFYRHSLNESCIPGIDTTAPQVGVTLSGSNSYNNVTWVDASNQPETGAYGGTGSGALKASTGVDIGLIMTSNDLKTTTTKLSCSNIVNLMSNAAKPYAVWTTQHPDEVAAINAAFVEDNNDKPKTCGDVVEGIGWIICPVMNFITKVNDASYRTISALLITPSLNMSTSSDNSLYQAWGAMRSLANVAFVIAFLIIIFSQLTSVGITNYGIKKMLPRLVIAAILVNLSYFVCAIAVDVSNVLGTSFIQFFNSIGGGLNQPKFTNGTGWTSLLLTVVGGGALLYAGLSILLPALITALFAIITVFLTLTVRQALIIILVVISPLAFVAYLLPNTESLFKKWQNLLTTLLLLFPIVAIVFGASALASQVIINSATNTFVQIMGALVAVIPLFLVPSLMKAGGSVLGKVSGAISNNGLMKGASGGLNKVAEDYRKDRLNTRDMRALKGDNQFGRGRFVRWRNKTKSIRSGRESEMNRANTEYIAGQAEGNAEFRNALAGGTNGIKIGGKVLIRGAAAEEAADMRALAGAINVKAELTAKEVKAASAVIEHMGLSSGQVNDLAKGGSATSKDGRTLSGTDDAVRKASIMGAVSIGTVKDVEEIIKSAGTMTGGQQKLLSSSIASSGIANQAVHLGGQTIDDIAQGNITGEDGLNKVTIRALQGGKYSAEKIASSDPDSLKRIINVIENNSADFDASTTTDPSTGVTTFNKMQIGEVKTSVKEQSITATTDRRLLTTVKEGQIPNLDHIITTF